MNLRLEPFLTKHYCSTLLLNFAVFFLLYFSCSDTVAANELREWTDNTGKHKITAILIEHKDGQARLKLSNGKIVSVPVAKLSQADQEHLAQLVQANKQNAPQHKDVDTITSKINGLTEEYNAAFKIFSTLEEKRTAGEVVTKTERTKSGQELQKEYEQSLQSAGLATESVGMPVGTDFSPIELPQPGRDYTPFDRCDSPGLSDSGGPVFLRR